MTEVTISPAGAVQNTAVAGRRLSGGDPFQDEFLPPARARRPLLAIQQEGVGTSRTSACLLVGGIRPPVGDDQRTPPSRGERAAALPGETDPAYLAKLNRATTESGARCSANISRPVDLLVTGSSIAPVWLLVPLDEGRLRLRQMAGASTKLQDLLPSWRTRPRQDFRTTAPIPQRAPSQPRRFSHEGPAPWAFPDGAHPTGPTCFRDRVVPNAS